MTDTPNAIDFASLGLAEPVLRALKDVGYESPSPIQAATIPPLLAGRDVLGQAQTGTGKTAAFALPILEPASTPRRRAPQALVLAPTRELGDPGRRGVPALRDRTCRASTCCRSTAARLWPAAARRCAAACTSSSARRAGCMDHLRRGLARPVAAEDRWCSTRPTRCCAWASSTTSRRSCRRRPRTRQIALFSATMPSPIRRIAQTYLRDPVEVTIEAEDRHRRPTSASATGWSAACTSSTR